MIKTQRNHLLTLILIILSLTVFLTSAQARELREDPSVDTLNFTQLIDNEDNRTDVTPHGELITGSFEYIFDIKSIYGPSDWRDIIHTGATGSVTGPDSGAIVVATGGDANGTATMRTVERIDYLAGSIVRAGIRVRGPPISDYQGDQFAEWGVGDKDNGFFFRADNSGLSIVIEDSGTKKIIPRDEWNIDTLDGSGDQNNPSGDNLNAHDGIIYNVIFGWYGNTPAKFYAHVPDTHSPGRERILVHIERFTGRTSIVDPNQPVTIRAKNEGEANNLRYFIGGRQASRVVGISQLDEKPPNEFVNDVTINEAEGTWVPILACKKDPSFPTENRPNSVRVQFDRMKTLTSSANLDYRVTKSDTSTGTFEPPTNWESESGMHCEKAPSGSSVSASSSPISAETGNPFVREFGIAGGQGNDPGSISESNRTVVLGSDQTWVLWARNRTGSNGIASATVFWLEQW